MTHIYLWRLFAMDVVSTMPIERLSFLNTHHSAVPFAFLDMLRLWRLCHVKSFFRSFCLVAEYYPKQGETWLGSGTTDFTDKPLMYRYISSFYWSMTTMSTVGYGDFHATNELETAFIIAYMIFSLGLNSYLIGHMTNLVVQGNRHTMEFVSVYVWVHFVSTICCSAMIAYSVCDECA